MRKEDIKGLRTAVMKKRLAEAEANKICKPFIRIGDSYCGSLEDSKRYEALIKIKLEKLNNLEKTLGDEKFGSFLEENYSYLKDKNSGLTSEERREERTRKLSSKYECNYCMNELKDMVEKSKN